MSFPGFTVDTMNFLAGLVHNNEKTWFEAHKADYQRYIVEPALVLIGDLDPVVRALSPHYRGIAKKQGGSLMRIYRDVRFGRDKTPYKTNIGIQFRHDGGADVHGPGYYVHFELGECFVGAGAWHPEPTDLLKIRRLLADKPGEYLDALAQARGQSMVPAGDSAVRVPQGFSADHAQAAEIKRKDFLVSADLDPDVFLGPGLVDLLATRFQASAAYMAWLCRALDIPF